MGGGDMLFRSHSWIRVLSNERESFKNERAMAYRHLMHMWCTHTPASSLEVIFYQRQHGQLKKKNETEGMQCRR
jgi:hypothetical protein